MRSLALEYLRCPECHKHLLIHHTNRRNSDIRSGRIECSECSYQYPVIIGRPVLLLMALTSAVFPACIGEFRYSNDFAGTR